MPSALVRLQSSLVPLAHCSVALQLQRRLGCAVEQGVQLSRHLATLQPPALRAAAAAIHCGRLDLAEAVYPGRGSTDLALDMRARHGDWLAVLLLVGIMKLGFASHESRPWVVQTWRLTCVRSKATGRSGAPSMRPSARCPSHS